MSNTMTDTKAIAELLPCRRRWLSENDDGITIWCRPPTRPPGLSNEEAIKNATIWFGKREVTCEECCVCLAQRPSAVHMGDPVIGVSKDPIKRVHTKESGVAKARAPKPRRVEMLGDGSIVYEKTGWEPPTIPKGYRRKSDDVTQVDAWTLVLVRPLCKHCELTSTRTSSCFCLTPIYTCTRKGETVQLDECETCRHRK